MPERRAHPRVSGPFEGSWDGAGTDAGRVVDLSVTGCFIESMTPPAVGAIAHVWIAVKGGRVNLTGEVIYAEANLGFAVRFVDPSEAVSELLAQEVASRLTP